MPMFGDGKHKVEFGFRQSRQKAGPEPIGKADVLVSRREFAGTIHTILFSAGLLALIFQDRFSVSLGSSLPDKEFGIPKHGKNLKLSPMSVVTDARTVPVDP